MMDCRIMIKAPVEEVKILFEGYEDIEFSAKVDWTCVQDFSYTQFFGWEIFSWIETAGDRELIYAYYDENLNAEFVHIKDGVCLRAYREYGGEVDTDQGDDPDTCVFTRDDVADYMDDNMF